MVKKTDWHDAANQLAIFPKPNVLMQKDKERNEAPDNVFHGRESVVGRIESRKVYGRPDGPSTIAISCHKQKLWYWRGCCLDPVKVCTASASIQNSILAA